jgi:hypothetical protein
LGEYVDIKEEVIGENKIHNNRLYILYASENLVRAANLQDDTGEGVERVEEMRNLVFTY